MIYLNTFLMRMVSAWRHWAWEKRPIAVAWSESIRKRKRIPFD
ncbi:hypothetical protein BSIN_2016 [Burkholderia singularis]|uniref:Uncharacterized protein n=1 Tax=Burkholderia singularis TaxID=1503053 RepID=A0A238H0I6_9BURK|nr:hypothetical protein BSIN_2016 [Burkholderia singularis]